jgi:hypothetical protein
MFSDREKKNQPCKNPRRQRTVCDITNKGMGEKMQTRIEQARIKNDTLQNCMKQKTNLQSAERAQEDHTKDGTTCFFWKQASSLR